MVLCLIHFIFSFQLNECCIALALAEQYLRMAETAWVFLMARTLHKSLKKAVTSVASSSGTHIVTLDAKPFTSPDSPHLPIIRKVMETTETPREYLESVGIGWGLPLLALGVSLMFESNLAYKHEGQFMNETGQCWFLNSKSGIITAFLMPNYVLTMMTIKELIDSYVITKRARNLTISERNSNLSRLYIFLASKMQLLVCIVNTLGVVAVVTRLPIVWIIFEVISSVKGVLLAISLACDCQFLANFDQNWQMRCRRRKRSKHDMIASVNTGNLLNYELL